MIQFMQNKYSFFPIIRKTIVNLKIKNRIDFNKQQTLNYFQKIYYFIRAPIIKFAYDKVHI